jgi:1,4-dihydroxy-2-naphthoyl-CoA hydrolase
MAPESVNALLATYLAGTIGMKVTEIGADRVRGQLPVVRAICTQSPAGDHLHGGAFMAFADMLGGLATLANLPEGARTTTIESKTNFLGAAPEGALVYGESTPLHRGRTTMVWQTRITSETGKLLALVIQTQLVISAAS